MIRWAWVLLACVGLASAVGAQEGSPEAPALVRRLGSEDPGERRVALAGLKQLRRAALPALEDGLKSDDPEVQGACEQLISLIRGSGITVEGGPIAAGTPWWKARSVPVSVNFQDSALLDILESFREDVGFRINLPPTIPDFAGRRMTVKLDRAPLEFLVGWILFHCIDRRTNGVPRFGWGEREAWIAMDPYGTKDKFTVAYTRTGALAGLSDADARSVVGFIQGIVQVEQRGFHCKEDEKGGFRLTATPYFHVEAGRLVDELRRASAGEKPLGAELDEEARARAEKAIRVKWKRVPLEEVSADLWRLAGVRVVIDARVPNWGDPTSQLDEVMDGTAQKLLSRLAEHVSTGRIEQRWGGWWLRVDAHDSGLREFWVHPVRTFMNDMTMADQTWKSASLEQWYRANSRPDRGPGPLTSQMIDDAGRFVLYGSRAASDTVQALIDGRARESERRQLALAGRILKTPAAVDTAAIEARITARLARDRITCEQPSEGFEAASPFRQVFQSLTAALDVRSISGTWGGREANVVRACRLKEVTLRVVWQWLNEGVPYYLHYHPDRRFCSYGLGSWQPWDGTGGPALFSRGRLHPTQEKAFLDILHEWDPAAEKAFRDVPAVSILSDNGPVMLPRPRAEVLFRSLGLAAPESRPTLPADAPDTAWLDREVAWPGGSLSLEESLFKLAELADFNFIFDVSRETRSTSRRPSTPQTLKVREILDNALRDTGAAWTVREENVLWVTSRASSGRRVVVLEEETIELGGEEAEAVAKEFAKTGDELRFFPATGRIAVCCAPERAGLAVAHFRAARTAVREEALAAARESVPAALRGDAVAPGYAGALALLIASETSPRAQFALADRLLASGYTLEAARRFRLAFLAAGDDNDLLLRSLARAARALCTFGPSSAERDVEAMRLCEEVASAENVPAQARADELVARAEILRRAGDRLGALDAYRKLEEMGEGTEETRRWRSRLDSLKQ